MASIRLFHQHMCGATLINDLNVVSSANCVVLLKERKPHYNGVTVALGSRNLDKNGTFIRIVHIEIHEFYELNELCYSPYDISVITVSS